MVFDLSKEQLSLFNKVRDMYTLVDRSSRGGLEVERRLNFKAGSIQPTQHRAH